MIEDRFLSDVAGFINSYITKVVLNESFEITSFLVKEVCGNLLYLEYLVPAASVSEVRLIQPQNALGNVVSTNEVYVPISSDTAIRQTIEVKEVLNSAISG